MPAAGPHAALQSAVVGGVLLALIEGATIGCVAAALCVPEYLMVLAQAEQHDKHRTARSNDARRPSRNGVSTLPSTQRL